MFVHTLISLAGCLPRLEHPEGALSPDAQGEYESEEHVPVLEEVVPTMGSNAGGVEVTIQGEHLSQVTEVRFGGNLAVLLDVSDDMLTVRTPAYGGEAEVDVDVSTGGRQGIPGLENGFRYLRDRSGQHGAFGLHLWTTHVGVAADIYEDSGYTLVGFHGRSTPVDVLDFFGNAGGCSSEPVLSDLPQGTTSKGISRATLETSLTTVELERGQDSGGHTYLHQSLERSEDFHSGSLFSLKTDWGDWDPFEVRAAFQAAPPSWLTQPSLTSMIGGIERTQLFQWEPQGGDWVSIQLDLYSSNWSNYTWQESLYCVVPNTGSYTVPGSLWSSWHTWGPDVVMVTFGEIWLSENAVLPDGSRAVWASASMVSGILDAE